MRNFIAIINILILSLFINNNMVAQIFGDNNWDTVPVFIDDFMSTGSLRTWNNYFIDAPLKKWKAYSLEAGVTHGHNEHQVYQKEQCVFNYTNGTMELVAEYVGGPMTAGDYSLPPGINADTSHHSLYYFSGEIDAYDDSNPAVVGFRYGFFEIRCKLPVHRGAFPAFWLWGNDPFYEEIDIFEYSWEVSKKLQDDGIPIADGSPRCFTGGIILKYPEETSYSHVSRKRPIIPDSEPDLSQWNTFSCEWSPNRVVWYFNGSVVNYYYGDSVPSGPKTLKTNYALDNWVINSTNTPITNCFPDTMVIDYIKVHKLKCDCDSSVIILNNTELAGFDYQVKKSIMIAGASNDSVYFPTYSKSIFRATDFIILKKNFNIPSGSELELIVHECPE